MTNPSPLYIEAKVATLIDIDSASYQSNKRKMSAWIGATELSITWMDTPEHYWTWNYLHEPRCDVAELHRVCWLNVVGKISSKQLTRKTSYAAYLVFKLNDQQHNLERAIASVRFVKEKARRQRW
ncbi:putative F-box protein PP2-B12 [Lycium ferocissimum]|uniref:putative F-box protein PP2-B12 n=1 Tax=Lycium ferocissimum TaxID=112874 RepID=UPI002816147E|nr:putative F-box protein PP2-B12 [Lycium ferocissimum]